ncbi:hypothetical protein ACHAXT_002725 [Thalassiosira profunda]
MAPRAPLPLLLAALAALLPSGATAAEAADNPLQAQLEHDAAATAAQLHRLQAAHHHLQAEFDAKLHSVQRIRDQAKYDLGGLQKHLLPDDQSASSSAPSLGYLFDDMDAISEKVAELSRRTEGVVEKVGEYNWRMLKGELGALRDKQEENGEGEDGAPPDAAVHVKEVPGLRERLGGVLEAEMARRDRFQAQMAEKKASESDGSESNETAAEEVCGHNASDPYVSLAELQRQFSYENIVAPSEAKLQQFLEMQAGEAMRRHLAADEAAWKERQQILPKRYERQFAALETQMQRAQSEGQCLPIPRAAELVGRALVQHYYDGTGLVDHASHEHGGSVVYELTSAPYVPPPRMDDAVIGGGMAAEYEHAKQKAFDEQAEEVYRMQKSLLRQDTDGLSEWLEGMNVWEWFTSFRFETLRHYLPDDWERLFDSLSYKLGGRSWSEYTPRGALDALVPDYVYHSLGLSNDPAFGRVFGRTASPEVAISSGREKTGGNAGGWVAKPMGHCYPLSMRPEDDPALALLGRHGDEDGDASLLVGPKYTVRLPYPVHVDAVSLEHRSFPIAPQELAAGLKGGESAPRWVRVVGFPPCPENGADEDECGMRGFDIAKPIDLGSFEYHRITVTGREDDYGGGDEDEDVERWALQGGRRRSIQTFAVKGGKLKPSSLLEKETPRGDDADGNTQCTLDDLSCGAVPEEKEPEPEIEPGQCAPPKDEDSVPSCGEDAPTTPSKPSSEGSGARKAIEAVSFIVEENWGGEYTCLYRVRVHGEAVTE